MERLTFDGLFCDIAICMENPCKYLDTGCTQRQVWERLKAYEDSGLTVERAQELGKADKAGCVEIRPCALGAPVYEVVRLSNRDSIKAGVPRKWMHGTETNRAVWNPWGVKERKMTETKYPKYGKIVFLDKSDAEKIAAMWNQTEEEKRRKYHVQKT